MYRNTPTKNLCKEKNKKKQIIGYIKKQSLFCATYKKFISILPAAIFDQDF
jgi:hypothetical protein